MFYYITHGLVLNSLASFCLCSLHYGEEGHMTDLDHAPLFSRVSETVDRGNEEKELNIRSANNTKNS